jgi:hypothetical protein
MKQTRKETNNKQINQANKSKTPTNKENITINQNNQSKK